MVARDDGAVPDEASAGARQAAAGDFAALRALIVARRGALPKRLVQVADFAVVHPQEIAFGTLAQIAARAGVQPSTLVRFAQALGFSGFSELQRLYVAQARARWPDYGTRLAALRHGVEPGAGDAAGLLRGFTRAAVLSLEGLDELADPAALERAVALLAGAGTIALLAARRAFPVAAYLAYALRRLRLRCELVDQLGGMAAEQVALLDAGDVLLAVSFAPYAVPTIELATAAAQAGVPVVAISDAAVSPLAQVATVVLEVAEADHAGFRSLAATFALATTLAVAAAGRRDRR